LRQSVIGIIVTTVYWLAVFSSLAILSDYITALLESSIIVASIYFGSKIIIRLARRILINIGGFLVPLILSVEMIFRLRSIIMIHPQLILVPIIVNVFITYLSSYIVAGRGVIVRFLPPIIGVGSSIALMLSIYSLSIYYSIPLSIIIGYFSTLLGADILGYKGSSEKLVFGGGGFYDALVVIPLFSPGISYGLSLLSFLVMR